MTKAARSYEVAPDKKQTERRYSGPAPRSDIAFLCRIIVYFNSNMKKSDYAVLFFIFLLLILNIWGALIPSHYNWGTQSFAFYSPFIGLTALLAALAGIFICSRPKSYSAIEKKLNGLSAIPGPVLFLGAASIFLLLSYIYSSEGLMWGDSKIILLTTPKIPSSTEASANFRNQPLLLLIFQGLQNLIGGEKPLEELYRWVDMASGLIFTGFSFLFVSRLKLNRTNSISAFSFLMAGGGTQFFFGYIENYALLYAFTGGYMVTGYLAMKKEIPAVVPLVLYLLIVGLHLGTLILIPTILIFLYPLWKENRAKAILILLGLLIGASALLWLSDYGPIRLGWRIWSAFKYDFLPILAPHSGAAYAMISPLHFLDWANLNLIVSPFIFPAAIIFILGEGFTGMRLKPENLFLVSAAFFGLLFTFLMNPALGMFRDWDLMASFLLPSLLFNLVIFVENQDRLKIKAIFIVALIAIIQTAAVIGINADEEKHLARAEVLTNPEFMANFAEVLYYDRLANAFWERKDYIRTKKWYERYTAIDSTNPRIIANLSDVYRKLNDSDKVYEMLKRSAGLGARDPKVYSNLSVQSFKHGKINEAIAMAETAVAISPGYAVGEANLGILYLSAGKTEDAIRHITRAISLGMSDPKLLILLGEAYEKKGNLREAFKCYSRYSMMMPSDSAIKIRSRNLLH